MLSKAVSQARSNQFVKFLTRGVYAPGNEPHVFINKHTRVVVQGMTGKHVSETVLLSYLTCIVGYIPH